ncbi:MAG: Na(+)-translocating NADH-quinone reductase subunit C [Thermoguttaceae bacterium]
MQDSLFRIVSVSVGVCLVCSVLVSTAAVVLKPYQEKNALLFKQQNILAAAGLIEPNQQSISIALAEKLFKDNIEAVVIDMQTGKTLSNVDPNTIDPKKDSKDANLSTDLGPADIARIRTRPNRGVVYLVRKEGKVERLIFPIYGKGLWSTIYGFIALNANDFSVAKINFYEHGETPGLGGEIANPSWQKKWEGKHIYGDDFSAPKIAVVKNGQVSTNEKESIYQVDGIAGSTLTSNGVSRTVSFWLGQNGYEPFLKHFRKDVEDGKVENH